MIKIEYPPFKPRIKQENGRDHIFDSLRKRWLVLTPEEWVRQNFIQYLIHVKKYPSSLLAQEKEIKLGELVKRFDILVYNTSTRPFMIVECKEMNVPIDERTLNQALRYNIGMPVPYIVITNGTSIYAFENKNGNMVELTDLPIHI